LVHIRGEILFSIENDKIFIDEKGNIKIQTIWYEKLNYLLIQKKKIVLETDQNCFLLMN